MVKQMKLRGQVRLNMDRTFVFVSTLYDGTPFECKVDIHDFELRDEFEPDRYTVDGWMFVVQEAQQADRCYLTMPKPSIVHGHQILVNELQLMPRVASIASFRPRTMTGSKSQEQGDLVKTIVEESIKTKKKSSKS